MVAQVKDIPEGQEQTVAHRIRQARKEAGLTMAQVAEQTGIPVRTYEKYEYGNMDPSSGRLASICSVLHVSVHWIMTGETGVSSGQAVSVRAAMPVPEIHPAIEIREVMEKIQDEAVDVVLSGLDEMDRYRVGGFVSTRRRAVGLEESLQGALRLLEPDELVAIAEDRDLFKDEVPSASFLQELVEGDLDEAEECCGNIQERILDAVILGVDLYSIELDALVDWANEEEVDVPGWGFSWKDHEHLVSVIRPLLRKLAFSGQGVNFGDTEAFPRVV